MGIWGMVSSGDRCYKSEVGMRKSELKIRIFGISNNLILFVIRRLCSVLPHPVSVV